MPVTNATFTPANATMISNMAGVVPVSYGNIIMEDIIANSVVMQLGKYEEMDSIEKEFDVFLNGIGAYWVGEGQRIQTSKPTWTKATMRAKKLGVILPVSREFLYYKQADFFEAMKPAIAEAFYKKFDSATLLNVDNPFTQSVEQSIVTAGNKITGDLSIANIDSAVAKLNDAGFEPNAYVSKVQNSTLLRALVRDENGLKTKVYADGSIDGTLAVNINKDIAEFKKGTLIAGDFDYIRYGIPYNMNYKISEDATISTITGEDGAPLNLFEREMVALRVTMDIAFMVINDNAFAKVEPTSV